jgi:hypothetical protein
MSPQLKDVLAALFIVICCGIFLGFAVPLFLSLKLL